MPPLVVKVGKLRWRLGLLQWFRFSMDAFFAASVTACAWLLLTRLFPVLGDALPVLTGLWAVALVAATVVAVRTWPDLIDAAVAADLRLDLRERFTSSLELADAQGAMVEALHRDALRHVDRLDVRRDFPLMPTRSMRWLLIPILLFGLGYVLLPEFDLLGHRERELEAKARTEELKARAHTLQQAARLLKAPQEGEYAPLASPAEQIETIAEQLETQQITEKQALARVASLSETLQKQRAQLEQQQPSPKLAGNPDKLSMGQGITQDLENGRPGDAAQKLRDMQQKLEEGQLSEQEKKQLAEDLKKLSEMMGMDNKQLAAALPLAMADTDSLANALDAMQLSLGDMASAMEQLAKLDAAMLQLDQWKNSLLGPSPFCRFCGKKLKPCKKGGNCKGCLGYACSGCCAGCGSGLGKGYGHGPWSAGDAQAFSNGMGGPGRGRGQQVGALPDANVGFNPTMLPGGITQGKMLANILQKSAPETGAEVSTEFITGALVSAQQEAEQALTKEEIPRGSKEFVRQYFGSLETEPASGDSPPE